MARDLFTVFRWTLARMVGQKQQQQFILSSAAVILGLLTILSFTAVVSTQSITGWKASFDPPTITVEMEKEVGGTFTLSGITNSALIKSITLVGQDENIARVVKPVITDATGQTTITGDYSIHGVFLGRQSMFFEVEWMNGQKDTVPADSLAVVVIREKRAIDTVFTVTVAVLVSIIYINFGAALQLDQLKSIMRRPVGPCIGFLCQFLFMPLISYGLGLVLFPNDHTMQLGMFFTGCSPAGGASNIWTAILGGNIDLSVTMTTISTFSAFFMMPLWIFTLGRKIFANANLAVPYGQISEYAFCLVVPLGVGLLIQKYMPRTRDLLVRILKPFSTLLIIFIVAFAIVANLYIFKLFSWQIFVAGMGLPWLGYMAGWLSAKVFKCKPGDALAIAVETGVQNTGIAIYLMRFSLDQPEGDLTTVVPVSVAIMTPIPLTMLFLGQLLYRR